MKMKRYEQGSIGMRTDKEGAWCKYEDAQKLQAENAALRTQLAEVTAKGIASIKEALALPTNLDALHEAMDKEREECAAICDRFYERGMNPAECAGAIRARKENSHE